MNMLNIRNMKKLRMINRSKLPKGKNNYVGIEIEFVSKLCHVALRNMFIRQNLHKYVQLKDDSSIDIEDDQYRYSHELCILVKEKDLSKIVNKVSRILKKNSSINWTCGLHVHLDMRNKDPKIAYANLFAAQSILYSMCKSERIENEYCTYDNYYMEFNSNDLGNRYVGINKSSYERHGTIEIRLHHGTIKATEIIGWVKTLLSIVNSNAYESATNNVITIRSIKLASRVFNWNTSIKKYVKRKIKQYKNQHEYLISSIGA